MIAFKTIDYKINNKGCFKKCNRLLCKKNNNLKNLENNNIVYVNSAFAGMCLIKSEILDKIEWSSDGLCEHINFCKEVRKYGKIILIPWLENFWDK